MVAAQSLPQDTRWTRQEMTHFQLLERQYRRWMCWRGATVLLASLALASLFSSTASACVLNNSASLSANGSAAQNTYTTQDSGNSAPVTFSFPLVFGSGQRIQFTENLSDLHKSLSSTSLAHPFLWRWGDGSYSIARTPSHTYRRAGAYVMSVYAMGKSEGDSWAPFDRATIKIVPPGELWRDNLGQEILAALNFLVPWAMRAIEVIVAAALLWGFLAEWGRHRRRNRVLLQ